MEHIKEILEFITQDTTFKTWVYIILFIEFLYVISLFKNRGER